MDNWFVTITFNVHLGEDKNPDDRAQAKEIIERALYKYFSESNIAKDLSNIRVSAVKLSEQLTV